MFVAEIPQQTQSGGTLCETVENKQLNHIYVLKKYKDMKESKVSTLSLISFIISLIALITSIIL